MARNVAAPVERPHVLEVQREMVVASMEKHPQLALRSSELGLRFTVGNRRRLWQQLTDALNREGPFVKTTEQWQEWWRKQEYEAHRDAAAIAQEQRSTGGGRLPGFRGRVLQLTVTVRLHGVTDHPYQEWQRIHRAVRHSQKGWPLHLCCSILFGHHVDSDHGGWMPSQPCRSAHAAWNRTTRCCRCCGGSKRLPLASLSRQRGRQRLRLHGVPERFQQATTATTTGLQPTPLKYSHATATKSSTHTILDR
ncbi:uncharacterized protein LOC142587319 [Dermacentor variabilis]|uniref:uncharacterized protein LOC142587319 n=1 Tax=Dermacentor variabilis TaxID=34621 RepID=UPI003F5C643C